MKIITTDQQKINLVSKLIEDEKINFDEALMLLQEDYNKEYFYYPSYPVYPIYEGWRITYDTPSAFDLTAPVTHHNPFLAATSFTN